MRFIKDQMHNDLHFPPIILFRAPANDRYGRQKPTEKPIDDIVPPTRCSPGGKLIACRYIDGSMNLMVVHPETGCLEYMPSINLPEVWPRANPEKYIWLISYRKSEGAPEALQKAGFVRLTGVTHEFGDGDPCAVLAYIKPKLSAIIQKIDSGATSMTFLK